MRPDHYQLTAVGGIKLERPATLAKCLTAMQDHLVRLGTVFIKDWVGNTAEIRCTGTNPTTYGVKVWQVGLTTPAWLAEVPQSSSPPEEEGSA